MLEIVHSLHQGEAKRKEMLREKSWWAGMSQPVENLVKICNSWQLAAEPKIK